MTEAPQTKRKRERGHSMFWCGHTGYYLATLPIQRHVFVAGFLENGIERRSVSHHSDCRERRCSRNSRRRELGGVGAAIAGW